MNTIKLNSGSSTTTTTTTIPKSSSIPRQFIDRSRTGPYPPRPHIQRITFNETFRALFPAILAVLLSMIVLSAFNHVDPQVWQWIQKGNHYIPLFQKLSNNVDEISTPTYTSPSGNIQWTSADRAKYEKLGAFTSSSYWESIGRQKEQQLRQQLTVPKPMSAMSIDRIRYYESLGPFTSSCYWESKGRFIENRSFSLKK
ncbi:hypothetical protein DFA_08255 [Cavenderia fasciculata]|uniref:Transmembrane protein n=1 Tax=Cavenderia fasciculata TaxID=261658 RepID=F4Q5K5_CACFS|nr:uncharacterized protein DFA_08255 [Cavenderia fasciculata]EGG17264.1 hypothetical protein DFA_08255 [Cavenderia fasciculata]|eukprot:XP_004355748.1 hypothetical protein DFA_08255 [Cavenderia fasciculata]